MPGTLLGGGPEEGEPWDTIVNHSMLGGFLVPPRHFVRVIDPFAHLALTHLNLEQ